MTGGGGTCGRDPRRLGCSCSAARPQATRVVGGDSPGSPFRARPRGRPGPANSAPLPSPPGPARHAPLTEEALHDPERVAQPVFSTGHGAVGRGQRGPCDASRRAERARNPASPRRLGRSSSAPSHARGAARAAGLGAPPGEVAAVTAASASALRASDGSGETDPTSASHNGGKPRPPTALPATWVELEREGWRERAAHSRRGGSGRGGAAILETGRDPAVRAAAILEMGRGRVLCCVWLSPCACVGGKVHQGSSLAQSLRPCARTKRHKFLRPGDGSEAGRGGTRF